MDAKDSTDEPRDSGATRLILGLRWPFVVLALAGLLFAAGYLVWRSVVRAPGAAVDAVERLGDNAVSIAEGFRTGTITTTFTASLPHLVPEGAGLLELAAMEATETFTRTDERWVLFDLVPLGATVTEIRVPVTYRYHVRLDDPWTLDVRGQTCVVQAPSIRPTLPPAIHTDGMEKRASEGWLRFNAAEQMDALERSITPTLNHRAGVPAAVDLVRDRCRRTVAEFVRSWLLAEEHWRSDRFRAVVVYFPGEAPTAETPEAPTVILEPEWGSAAQ